MTFTPLVGCAVLLIVFVAGTVIYTVMLPIISIWSALNLLLYAISVGLMMISFFLSVFVPPGGVPTDWVPEMEGDGMPVGEASSKGRTCRKCDAWKPARTHHCSECDTCILRMDHHCPWIGGCVGFGNHKPFILFLLYTCISALYSVAALLHGVFALRKQPSTTQSPDIAVFLMSLITAIAAGFLSLGGLCAVGTLFGYQLSNIRQNKTTVEDYESEDAEYRARRRGSKYIYPHDRGSLFNNLSEFLGPNILTWFLPWYLDQRDGLSFNHADIDPLPIDA